MSLPSRWTLLAARSTLKVLVSTTDTGEILTAFLSWTEERLYRRGRLW